MQVPKLCWLQLRRQLPGPHLRLLPAGGRPAPGAGPKLPAHRCAARHPHPGRPLRPACHPPALRPHQPHDVSSKCSLFTPSRRVYALRESRRSLPCPACCHCQCCHSLYVDLVCLRMRVYPPVMPAATTSTAPLTTQRWLMCTPPSWTAPPPSSFTSRVRAELRHAGTAVA